MKPSIYNEFWHRSLRFRKKFGRAISAAILYTGLVTTIALIYDAGFDQTDTEEEYLFIFYNAVKRLLIGLFVFRNILNIFNIDKPLRVKILDALLLTSLVIAFFALIDHGKLVDKLWFLHSYKYLHGPLFIAIFAIELSRNAVSFYTRSINPALIFLISFFMIIAIGAGLLMLPNATNGKLSLVDALFTSTSAVCITGLIVQDTATFFTGLGQTIILILIQIGGLGIMTFAGFIGHMFTGGASYQQRLLLGEFSYEDRIGDVIKTIYKTIVITLTVETIGAIGVYVTTPPELFESRFDHVFFAVFHSISSFCNAGFSNYSPLGLYDVQLRFNYPFLLILAFLLIFGGLGFPIVLNFYNYTKLQLQNVYAFLFKKRRFRHVPYALNFSSKLIMISTTALILIGWVGFFIFEYDGVLREHSFVGKLATSFFGATTPRTAGFNSVDMSQLMFPTVMLTIILMYIGASPGGTGGGIKTTTFSVMIMNFWSLASGREKLIFLGREIKQTTLNRTFSIISLSLVILGTAITLINIFDPQHDMIAIIFETFSAFSTVGLTLGITFDLSDKSKLVLILVMFIGRVGALTFLSAFIFRKKFEGVRYPKEDIIY